MTSMETASSRPCLTAAIAPTLVTLSSMMIGWERNRQRSPEGASLPSFPGTACFNLNGMISGIRRCGGALIISLCKNIHEVRM